jgi:hypothetical protein
MKGTPKRLLVWAAVVLLLLVVPLLLTIRDGAVEGVGWNWTLSDFVFAFVLLFGAGVAYELVSKKMSNGTYRLAVAAAVVSGLLLVWVNAAVGLVSSEDNPINLLVFGVILVGIIGALIARFTPRGMCYTLLAMAVAQAVVGAIALSIGAYKPENTSMHVIGINAFFVALFIFSALLFNRAVRDVKKTAKP